jgi:general secretion pathway protein A
MDYFSILNLKKEPFSNSPDPGLFYPSPNHVECLHSIEMAIRLKRGLNLVLGEVGTGKTTLCRKLIQQISSTAGNDLVEMHLLLDPSFSSSYEFLSGIAGHFGLTASAGDIADRTEWQLKEAIKNCLFAKGVEEGKIVVLLIDEGQKLPDFCLEILREFLNYETNDCKLLQIVIFAQQEFREKIGQLANLANRINLCYSLTPLGFGETGRMIAYRISQTSEDGAGRPLFTWPGLFALYRETGGNPRSINMLCHHIVLSLIIQNRVKAGWSLVRSCAGRLTLDRRSKPVNLRLAFMVIILIASLSFLVFTNKRPLLKAASSIKERFQAAAVVNSSPKADASGPEKRKNAPSVLGQLSIGKDRNLWHLFHDIYASHDPDTFRKFVKANLTASSIPSFISDPDMFREFVKANPTINNIQMVHVGELVTIPAITASEDNIPKKPIIEVARAKTLTEAYDLLRSYAVSIPDLMLLPFWNRREGLVFALVVKKQFPDRQAALEALKHLTLPMPGDTRVLDTWDDDTVFYHNLEDRS